MAMSTVLVVGTIVKHTCMWMSIKVVDGDDVYVPLTRWARRAGMRAKAYAQWRKGSWQSGMPEAKPHSMS